MKKTIRFGTRGSPLALVQAEEVRKKLFATHPDLQSTVEVEIVPIRTAGDWKPEHKEKTFIELGGNKGLFTKEIEDALLTGHIDMAIHSMKDVASWLPDSLDIACVLDREDPRDAFIGREVKTLDELPSGAIVGTSSLRRQSQILARRPDLRVTALRGNVDTRLKKLADGLADATLLAVAGLSRLGLANRISSILEPDIMLPAAAQGTIGIEIRRGDDEIRNLLAPLNSAATAVCVHAERALLKILDGSCHTPVGVLAQIKPNGRVHLDAVVAKPDGTSLIRVHGESAPQDTEKMGIELGHKLKAQLPADFFTS